MTPDMSRYLSRRVVGCWLFSFSKEQESQETGIQAAHQNGDATCGSNRSSLEKCAREDLLSKCVEFVAETSSGTKFTLWNSRADKPSFSQLTATSTGVARIR